MSNHTHWHDYVAQKPCAMGTRAYVPEFLVRHEYTAQRLGLHTRARGEIKDGEVTRTDHDGTSYQTTGPTTTQAAPIKPVALQEVIVRPQKN